MSHYRGEIWGVSEMWYGIRMTGDVTHPIVFYTVLYICWPNSAIIEINGIPVYLIRRKFWRKYEIKKMFAPHLQSAFWQIDDTISSFFISSWLTLAKTILFFFSQKLGELSPLLHYKGKYRHPRFNCIFNFPIFLMYIWQTNNDINF